MSADTAGQNPFRGLRRYGREDEEALFGRDMDFTLMRDRILSNKTTLLFARSGVGKTSFLEARVLPALRDEFVAGCCHREWAELPPVQAVLRSIGKELDRTFPPGTTLSSALSDFRRIKESPEVDESPLPIEVECREFLLVLDQFEEPFQYFGIQQNFKDLIDQLVAIINDRDLQVRVVLSMRDDFLGRLAVFDNLVPDLFNNYYRLKSPSKSQAAEIIVRTTALAGREVDPEGLAALVDHLATFRQALPDSSAAANEASRSRWWVAMRRWFRVFAGPFQRLLRWIMPAQVDPPVEVETVAQDYVLPPFLQIVCRELWNDDPPPRGFLSSYLDTASRDNKAAVVLTGFCRTRLDQLDTDRQRDLAARAFDYLMTRDGAKMLYPLPRLAEHMRVERAELDAVLERLSDDDSKILRRFKGTDKAWWYELYHDMYALVLADWKRWYQTKRHRQKQLLGVLVLTLGGFAAVYLQNVTRDWDTIEQASEDYPRLAYARLLDKVTLKGLLPFMAVLPERSWASYWDRRAAREGFREDRDTAVLYQLEAMAVRDTALRRSRAAQLIGEEYSGPLAATWAGQTKAPDGLHFSADERQLFIASSDGRGHVWNLETGAVAALSLGGASDTARAELRVSRATFLADERNQLITLSQAGLEIWAGGPGGDWSREGCWPGVSGYVVMPDNQSIVAGIGNEVRALDLGQPQDQCDRAAVAPDNPAQSTAQRRAVRAEALDKIVTLEFIPSRQVILSVRQQEIGATSPEACVIQWPAMTPSCFPIVGSKVVVSATTGVFAASSDTFFLSDQGIVQLYALDGRRIGGATIIDSAYDPEMVFVDDRSQLNVISATGEVTTLDLASGAVVGVEKGSGSTLGASISPGGVIAEPHEEGLMLRRASDRRILEPIISESIARMEFGPTGKYLATAGDGGKVRLWTLSSFRPTETSWQATADFDRSTAISTSSQCLAAINDAGNLVVRRLPDGSIQELPWQTAEKPADAADALAIDHGCRYVAGAWTGIVRAWHINSQREIALENNYSAARRVSALLAFSPDGSRLIVTPGVARAGPFAMQVWNPVNGRSAGTANPELQTGRVSSITFTPDSRYFAVKTSGRPLMWFSAVDGSAANNLPSFAGAVMRASATPEVRSVEYHASLPLALVATNSALQLVAGTEIRSTYQTRETIYTARLNPVDGRPAVIVTVDGIQMIDLSLATAKVVGAALIPGIGEQLDDAELNDVEFIKEGTELIVSHGAWIHRLALKEDGLEIVDSRLLPGAITHLQKTGEAARVIAEIALGNLWRIEALDLDARSSGATLDKADLETRLGRRINEVDGKPSANGSAPLSRPR